MVPEMEPDDDLFKSFFQTEGEPRQIRFDYTGARGLHVSPRNGMPKVAQITMTDSMICF